jgi:heptosyltransferase II
VRSIVVRAPNWLGDAVMATCILEDLAIRYPEAKITVLCQVNIAPVFLNNPFVHAIQSFKRANLWIHRANNIEVIEQLVKESYDVGVLLTHAFSSAWWFYRAGVKRRLGYQGRWRSFLLTDSVPFSKNRDTQHEVQTYKELLAPLGISLSHTKPHLYITEEEKEAAKDLLLRLGATFGKTKILGINPTAAYGSSKCWPKEKFRTMAQELQTDDNHLILFFGDEAGKEIVDEMTKGLGDNVINLAGRTSLRELFALISFCDLFISGDSGPMHSASALNIPLIALFGSTSFVRTGPYESKTSFVIEKQEGLSCAPCYKRICPIDFPCMKKITEEEVIKKIHEILKE